MSTQNAQHKGKANGKPNERSDKQQSIAETNVAADDEEIHTRQGSPSFHIEKNKGTINITTNGHVYARYLWSVFF
jgi:hypothetical protein